MELYQQALQLRTALKLSPPLIAEPSICIGNAYTYKEQYGTAKTFFVAAKGVLADADNAVEMLADLDKKIGMCSVGDLNIVADAAESADAESAHAATADASEAEVVIAPKTRKREEIAAKIASATVVQVSACFVSVRCQTRLLRHCRYARNRGYETMMFSDVTKYTHADVSAS